MGEPFSAMIAISPNELCGRFLVVRFQALGKQCEGGMIRFQSQSCDIAHVAIIARRDGKNVGRGIDHTDQILFAKFAVPRRSNREGGERMQRMSERDF